MVDSLFPLLVLIFFDNFKLCKFCPEHCSFFSILMSFGLLKFFPQVETFKSLSSDLVQF